MKKIAVTLGDPSGIGPEIVLKALTETSEIYNEMIPIVFGHAEILKDYKKRLNKNVQIETIEDFQNVSDASVNKIYCFSKSELNTLPPLGTINAQSGALAFEYIEASIEEALAGNIQAVATAPINKESLKAAKVPFLDHTAMYSKLTNSTETMTLFVTGGLRVFFLTRHIPFKDISAALDKDEIVKAIANCDRYLKQIGIENPKIAVAALNPHAGEHGLFGDEEEQIIRPAVERAAQDGFEVSGPIAADSVFQLCKEGHFDAVLSLYHDQGHIAAKTLDFYGTVSLTMGLPFLRTSVDHGTALELAGKNIANSTSMAAAIIAAKKYMW